MTKLPRLSGQECIAILLRHGFRVVRQRGSHIVLRRDEPFAQVVVPDHRELDRGTLRAVIRQSGLTVDDFVE